MMNEDSDAQLLIECEVVLLLARDHVHQSIVIEDINTVLYKLKVRINEHVLNQKNLGVEPTKLEEINDRHGY